MSSERFEISKVLRPLGRWVGDWLYPPECWVCERPMVGDHCAGAHGVCSDCHQSLTSDASPTCPRCGHTIGPFTVDEQGRCPQCRGSTFHFDGAIRLAPYDKVMRDVILRMKRPKSEPLVEAIAELWTQAMMPKIAPLQPDVVVPIPLHWSRRWLRGFNVGDILAHHLAAALGVRVVHALVRTRRTAPQTGRGVDRRANVRGAFRSAVGRGKFLNGKKVILVDDVITTGSTASEAAGALKSLQPSHIHVAVLADGGTT